MTFLGPSDCYVWRHDATSEANIKLDPNAYHKQQKNNENMVFYYKKNKPITFFASFELGESSPVGIEDKELVAVPLGVCVSSSSEPLCVRVHW